MPARESIDVDIYDDREEAVWAALEAARAGDTIIICRGDWAKCPDGEICPMCARVKVVVGMTATDALALATAPQA